MQLDTWSLIIIIFISQGLFLLGALWWQKTRRQQASTIYLSCLLVLLMWMMAEFLSVRNVYRIDLNVFYGTRYGSWFALGPITFFLFKSLTDSDWQFRPKKCLHFLPFLLFVLLLPAISGESLSQRQIHYGMLSVFDYRPKTVTGFEQFYAHIFYLQFIHLAGYLLYNLRLIQAYKTALADIVASRVQLRWLWLFNGLLLLTLILAASYLYILFQADFYRRSLDYIYVLPMGLFVYSVGFRLTSTPFIRIPLSTATPKPSPYANSTLKTVDKLKFEQQLDEYMSQEKPYLRNDLRLAHLAEALVISPHHLSQIINQEKGSSFFDFINVYRVKEAQQLIQQEPQWTLLQVAFAAGFNNKTSFVNAFKKNTKQTPSAYRKTIVKRVK